MEQYNDEAIISPDKIEQMAKEYNLAKNNTQLLKNTVNLYQLKSSFIHKDECFSFIMQAVNDITELIDQNLSNDLLKQTKQDLLKMRMLYETFFEDTELKYIDNKFDGDKDKQIVVCLLHLIEKLIPLSSQSPIMTIIQSALTIIERAI